MRDVAQSVLRGDALRAFVRLCAASVILNGTFVAVALVELRFGFQPWQTIAVNFPVAVAISFLISKNWVFAARRPQGRQVSRYVIVYLCAYFSSMLCARALEWLGLPDALAVLLSLVPTAAGLFIGLNYWVFPKQSRMAE